MRCSITSAAGRMAPASTTPKNVREAMVTAATGGRGGTHGIAAVGLLHPVKGRARSFRELIAGRGHQFNAVSRSSLLLGVDPDDDQRRVLVRGKGNHSAEFLALVRVPTRDPRLRGSPATTSRCRWSRTPRRETAWSRSWLDSRRAPVTGPLADALAALLTTTPQSLADLARAVGRDPKDGSVRNALKKLENEGSATKTEEGWVG